DFLQCAVYGSDDSTARLIGVEYIVSGNIFESLSPDEQKLWHSHAYEIKSGFMVNPRVPEMTYDKFWCTWQTEIGDKLPMGWPTLMMSSQPVNIGVVRLELVAKKNEKYNILSEGLKKSRIEIE
ncbi:hypothetical protein MIMGU_mgv1a022459mg, partial [Erythranthe guttata]